MPPMPLPMIAMLAVFLIVPAACAGMLRLAGLRHGSSILGGVLAGLLLGSTVLGRMWPAQFERIILGAESERTARQEMINRHKAEVIIAQQDQLNPVELLDVRDRQARELAVVDLEIQTATWIHQRPVRLFVLILCALVLGSSGAMSVPRPAAPQGWAHVVSTGLAAAALPASLAFLACRFWWDLSPAESMTVAAALSIGPWILGHDDRAASDDAEVGGARMIQSAGRVASCLALIAVVTAIAMHFGQRDLWLACPMLMMPIGWWILAPSSKSSRGNSIVKLNQCLIIPSVAAWATMPIDVLEHSRLWPIVFVLLLSDNARWLGAMTGALALGGRRILRTMRLVLGSIAAGPTQLTLAAFGVWTGLLDEEFAWPLVLGAALMEVSTPIHRKLAQQLDEFEQEVESALSDDDQVNDDLR